MDSISNYQSDVLPPLCMLNSSGPEVFQYPGQLKLWCQVVWFWACEVIGLTKLEGQHIDWVYSYAMVQGALNYSRISLLH